MPKRETDIELGMEALPGAGIHANPQGRIVEHRKGLVIASLATLAVGGSAAVLFEVRHLRNKNEPRNASSVHSLRRRNT